MIQNIFGMKNSILNGGINGKLIFRQYLFVLFLLPALFFQIEAKSAICCIGGDGEKCWRPAQKKSLQMTRTFIPPGKSIGKTGSTCPFNAISQVTPPVITYADLNYAYSPQNDLIFYTQDYSSVTMNIGIVNKVTPQQWVMPVSIWDAIDSAVGVPVSQTPFYQSFPTATHCKLYEYVDYGSLYSYF